MSKTLKTTINVASYYPEIELTVTIGYVNDTGKVLRQINFDLKKDDVPKLMYKLQDGLKELGKREREIIEYFESRRDKE